MSKNKQLLTISMLMVVSIVGCTMPNNEDVLKVDDAGVLDTTTYAGLKIYGEIGKNSEKPEQKALDIFKLHVALFTKCYDENVYSYPKVGGRPYCKDENIVDYGPTDETKCYDTFCMSQLYLCMGYKLTEIAEATDVIEFSTEIFQYTDPVLDPSGWSFSLVWESGEYRKLETDRGTVNTYHYRIPPLSAEHKTLAYMAAQAAFRKAGVLSGSAVDIPNCMERLTGQDERRTIDDGVLYVRVQRGARNAHGHDKRTL